LQVIIRQDHQLSHDNEYDTNTVKMLELVWGRGYMAPGGPENVAKLLRGTAPEGKRILDIGCDMKSGDFE